MSLESVRDHLAAIAPDLELIVTEESSATVDLAAKAHGVVPGQIAKTLSFQLKDRIFLVVARGDARMDNKKAKAAFGGKVKMVGLDEVENLTGHPVGGVCPFGLAQPLPVYCDVSLKDFDVVIPAAGATNAAVRIAPDRMAEITSAEWVDVCQPAVASLLRNGETAGSSLDKSVERDLSGVSDLPKEEEASANSVKPGRTVSINEADNNGSSVGIGGGGDPGNTSPLSLTLKVLGLLIAVAGLAITVFSWDKVEACVQKNPVKVDTISWVSGQESIKRIGGDAHYLKIRVLTGGAHYIAPNQEVFNNPPASGPCTETSKFCHIGEGDKITTLRWPEAFVKPASLQLENQLEFEVYSCSWWTIKP